MAITEKVFVAFDGPNDQDAFFTFKAMVQSDGTLFNLISARELYGRLDKDSDDSIKEKIYRIMDECMMCV
ncbi:MAG: hypothetical protein WCT17_01425, partial [Bacilli bacterium]